MLPLAPSGSPVLCLAAPLSLPDIDKPCNLPTYPPSFLVPVTRAIISSHFRPQLPAVRSVKAASLGAVPHRQLPVSVAPALKESCREKGCAV